VPSWRFGVFEIDPEAGELRKAGRRVHLAGQPFHLLALLVARPGEVVARDELRRSLWGEGTFVEFDQSLNFCVGRVRAALGDDARTPRYLETLPRRGYRFIAPVVEIGPASPPRVAAPSPPFEQRIRLAGAVAALLFLGLLQPHDGETARAHSREQATPPAREAFESGLRLWAEGVEGRRRSIHMFQEAARRDPLFAEAHYAAADTYLDLAEQGHLPAAPALAFAQRAAEQAVALEDNPKSRLILASARFFQGGDWAGADAEYQRALELAPDSDIVLATYARFLSAAGRHADALQAIDRAEAHAPSCELIVHESGWVRYRARLWSEAIRKFAQAAALGTPGGVDPSEWRRYNRLRVLFVHQREQDWPEAGEDALAIAKDAGTSPDRLTRFAKVPPRERVERLLRASLGMMSAAAEREAIPPTRFAEIHAVLGEEDAALDWLERAAREHHPALVYSLSDPHYEGLRARPRFRRLQDAVGSLPARPALSGLLVVDASNPR
jgi:DNA-binding winged helix-turn-helix (wHTH) protein/tetratricopeptide (TPR) repeat protein